MKIAIRICFKYLVFSILKEEDSDQYLFQRRKLSMSFQMKELLNITDPQSLEGIRGDVNGETAVLMKLAHKKTEFFGRDCAVYYE